MIDLSGHFLVLFGKFVIFGQFFEVNSSLWLVFFVESDCFDVGRFGRWFVFHVFFQLFISSFEFASSEVDVQVSFTLRELLVFFFVVDAEIGSVAFVVNCESTTLFVIIS